MVSDDRTYCLKHYFQTLPNEDHGMCGKDKRIAELEAKISKIKEDIRWACGCTSGDSIRSHLEEYL